MTALRRASALALAAVLTSQAIAADRSALAPLPEPALTTMGEATRERLELLRDRVEDLTPSASDGELAEAYGTLGTYYIAHHFNDAAEVAFGNAALLAPDSFRWAYYLGFVYQMVGKLDLERDAFERALALRPEDVPAHLRLAELLLALGENEEAYRRFKLAGELSPAEAAALGGLGRAALALDRPEEAVGHLEKALELQPGATIVHYQLALAYRGLGDMEAARAHLELRGDGEISYADPLMYAIEPLKKEDVVEAVLEMAAEPTEHDDRDVALFAGAYLTGLPGAVGRIRDAVEALALEAEQQAPSSKQAASNRLTRVRLHFAAASIRLEEGDLGAARSEVEAALALAPDMVPAMLMLGFVLEETGDPEAAIERYSAVLELDPDSTRALRSRANARFSLRRDREAIADLERLCGLGHERDGARIRLAVAYHRLGELETAKAHYMRALELNLGPLDAAQVHHHLGIIEMRTGSADRAIEEYRIALELQPQLVAARLDLGEALKRLGRYQESAEVLRHVVDADSANVRARQGQAEALESLGHSREARQRLEEGWQAIPESVELLHALARLLASAADPEVRDGERALDLAQRTLRAGSTPSRIETLAMASAEAGLFADAVTFQREVIQAMRWQGRVDVLPRLEANLARYKAGLTCCESVPGQNRNRCQVRRFRRFSIKVVVDRVSGCHVRCG